MDGKLRDSPAEEVQRTSLEVRREQESVQSDPDSAGTQSVHSKSGISLVTPWEKYQRDADHLLILSLESIKSIDELQARIEHQGGQGDKLRRPMVKLSLLGDPFEGAVRIESREDGGLSAADTIFGTHSGTRKLGERPRAEED